MVRANSNGRRRYPGALAPLILAATSVGAAPSPFADKPCLSYSSFRNQELRWGDAPLDDFGPTPVKFDVSGLRALKPSPPPGVHPRILCSPADLPDIRRRLKETRCGQQVWRNLLSWTHGMKATYDDKADYARPDLWNGSFGGLHGPVPLFRLGPGGWKSDRFRRLVDGDGTAEVGFFWNVFPLEAFRCWIEDDKAAAGTLAKAVMTALQSELKAIDAKRKEKKETRPRQLALDDVSKGNGLAFTYDFLFDFLAPEQKKALHAELAETTWYHDNYGTFNDATNTRSNWASFSYWLIQLLAIEGEPGFNDLKYLGLYRGWRNFLTFGFYPSGAVLEGEAKDQLGLDGIMAFARRGTRENLAGHPHLRAQASRFLPLSVTPTGGGSGAFGQGPFLKFDLLGGIGSINPLDAIGLKFMLPDDKAVDWVFRKQVGEDYRLVPDRPDGYHNALLFWALYATDFDPANDDPAKLGLGHTFFCGERALMMTRSGWQGDALMLGLHVRSAKGGHPYADRNAIALCGAGRAWSIPGAFDSFDNARNSLVVVDGQPQDLWVPARVVDFRDNPLATFAVGDAKYAWDWKWKNLEGREKPYTKGDVDAGRVDIPAGWQPVRHALNDFAFTKRAEACFARPMFELPSWIGVRGSLTPVVCQPNYPVKKAFRTAGIVRGARPYALVVDDIQKDDAARHYDWILVLQPDLQIVKIDRPDGRDPATFDVILNGDPPATTMKKDETLTPLRPGGTVTAGQPLLLVRVLSLTRQTADGQPPAGIDEIRDKRNTIRRLVIPSDAVAPDYKVLLYAYREGDPLPATTWNAGRTQVTVAWPDQKDVIAFAPAPCGKTNVTVTRLENGASRELVRLDRDAPPLGLAPDEKAR